MLDSTTKRRIDACRDILVGRVPDPKSQVEQITLALIYKFMDDMDATSEEFGGKRAFFAGEFAQYGWARLLSPATGGADMVNLYSESIARMGENPGVPALFRDIFKRAYLPYRDPETLRAFLKEINGFTYEHSEKLGDAFEYLLSVLGSQGDAGQFRTPRHLIDFIVEVVDPQKGETLLDPACGTAGFLISAYKHILAANQTARPGDLLTPDERTQLAHSVTGYDISPDMVRLSLANLYLHGFADPQVEEYDTLTSDDKWNEYADVILANPPFMSPKGGIRPHKRFSVQSSRSEVLFVDYIADHLTPTGRAGVIVPEGIIFQSGGSYKALRKMLVENSLVAVVSLPAGVFQPYSGVKTSVLVMDKKLAKGANSILFVKIASDGFGLGAQRRAVATDDLPEAARLLHAWRESLREGTAFDPGSAANVQVVAKAKIAESGDYNLSGDRYIATANVSTDWPMLPLSEICEFRSGLWKGEKEPLHTVKILRNTNFTKNGFLNTADVVEHPVEEKQLESRRLKYGDIILEKSGGGPTQPVGRVALFNIKQGEYSYSNFTARIRVVDDRASPIFVWLLLNSLYQSGRTALLQKQTSGIRNLDNAAYQSIEIPLPPLAVQQEIVAEIEGYQKLIDGARQVVENYTPRIVVRPEWPVVELGEVCDAIMDGTHFSPQNSASGEYLYITAKNIKEAGVDLSSITYVTKEEHDKIYKRCPIKKGDVLYIKDGATAGIATINTLDKEFSLLSSVAVLRGNKERLNNIFLCSYLNSKRGKESMLAMVSGVAITRLTLTKLNAAKIPLPDLDTQRAIVAEIEEEQGWVDANKALIQRFEAKIKATIGRVWGEDAAG